MYQSVERYIDFITKNKLTQEQFLFLYLIKRKKGTAMRQYMETFPHADGSMIGQFLKKDLIIRGFVKKIGNGENFNDYETTEQYNLIFVKDPFEAAMQIWKLYPGFVKIEGRDIPLTNMDKYQFTNKYCEMISHDLVEHLQVVEDVKFGAENGLIRVTIEKFIHSAGWEKIREVRLEREKKSKTVEENF